MAYIHRLIEPMLLRSARTFPSLVLTGPRRAGKTFLLKKLFPDASYILLESPDIVARIRSDPRGLLEDLRTPVILDEIQNAPELFQYIRSRIDTGPRRMGQWIITGSQESGLMRGVSESMAGRAAIHHLYPLSVSESPRVSMLRGGYPEVVNRPKSATVWYSSYLQTYLERDVRAVTDVRDLVTFRRFLALVASRHGQTLNKTDIAAPMGVSVPTVSQWLAVLETTAQVIIVPPYFENFGKRLIKTPKVYIADSGLACHLLGIRTIGELGRSPFKGSIFEGFVASEVVKAQANAGLRPELYFFRDEQGLEVDFMFPGPRGSLSLVECKATRTPTPAMAAPMLRLAESLRKTRRRNTLDLSVVHLPSNASHPTAALAPGVKALDVPGFASRLSA